MGINLYSLKYIHEKLKKYEKEFNKFNICLLGNLYLRDDTFNYQKQKMSKIYKVAMDYFKELDMSSFSIDINGKDGAIPIDLSEEIPDDQKNKYHILLNGGTAEHVNNQYQCFKNIHDLCKDKSLIFHISPEVGSWPNHCNNWYTEEFFRILGYKNNYNIIDIHRNAINGKGKGYLIYATYQKIDDWTFMSEDSFYRLDIHRKL